MKGLTDAGRLTIIRAAHTAIYVVMATCVLVVVYAGLSGAHGAWLWPALALVLIECVVFVGAGMKCPLTALAVKYGARKDGAFDTFFPEQATHHTLKVFGPLVVIGLASLALRWASGALPA